MKPVVWIAFALASFNCYVEAFHVLPSNSVTRIGRRRNDSALSFYESEGAGVVEMGVRYSMVPMPDSMMHTTLYVGNLCEFVHDKDLSDLFQSASTLNRLPACVARKIDTTSLHYGFVSFPTVQEKEAAILKFHGTIFRGKRLRVDCIRDHPSKRGGRVRVPEQMVEYVSGQMKKTRNGEANTLRRNSRDKKSKKKKGAGKQTPWQRSLNPREKAEMERAVRKGYLSLRAVGSRSARKGSPLAKFHHKRCVRRSKPQILLYKACRGNCATDEVVIDLSTLHLNTLDPERVDALVSEVLREADDAGMALLDNPDNGNEANDEGFSRLVPNDSGRLAWSSNPDWKLRYVNLGVFTGERHQAKTMATALGKLWDIPENGSVDNGRKDAYLAGTNIQRKMGLSQYRKRGGGHRQAW